MTEPIDIADLRAKLAAATPRPWSVNVTPTARHSAEFRAPGPWNGFLLASAHTNTADLKLIVAAVNALPALLDEIERLRGFVDSLGVDADEYHDGEWWDGYRQAQREIVLRASKAARQAGGTAA